MDQRHKQTVHEDDAYAKNLQPGKRTQSTKQNFIKVKSKPLRHKGQPVIDVLYRSTDVRYCVLMVSVIKSATTGCGTALRFTIVFCCTVYVYALLSVL